MDKQLLEMIVCPKCKGKLEEIDGRLVCDNCGLSFEICDGIPILLMDEAERL